MRALATLHRWWGVAFCLLFAMWFASGIVMHFVPYPERHERPATSEVDAARGRADRIDYDQWTVSREYDRDRPLDRIALNDEPGTEVYLSSVTGAVVLTTTRGVRVANYLGSIPHWIYPTPLRHHASAWRALLWWLSLLGTIGAAIGVIIGVVKLAIAIRDRTWPYRGLQAWHHALGLVFAPFILTWIFSGFLSLGDSWPLKSFHTLDFAPLDVHALLRTCVIVGLCLCGLAFSLTGVVLAWRRVRTSG
jgi:PepSY-associated transmembrane protein